MSVLQVLGWFLGYWLACVGGMAFAVLLAFIWMVSSRDPALNEIAVGVCWSLFFASWIVACGVAASCTLRKWEVTDVQ